MKKEKKPKRPFNVSKDQYDPKVEGYGNADEWKSAFGERMGKEEAKRVVADESPYSILGVTKDATWPQIKTAFRKLAMQHHPDKGGDAATFRKIRAAFELLIDQYE